MADERSTTRRGPTFHDLVFLPKALHNAEPLRDNGRAQRSRDAELREAQVVRALFFVEATTVDRGPTFDDDGVLVRKTE